VVGTRLGVVATVALDEGTVRPIAQLDSAIHSVSVSGAEVLAGDGEGRVWLLDLDPDTAVAAAEDMIFRGHQPVRSIVSVDPERALTGWSDGAVRLIDRRGRLLDEFVAHDEPIRDIAYAPASESFAATGDDGLVSRWDLSGTSRLIHPRLTIAGELVGAIDASDRVFVAGTTGRLSELRPGGTLVDRSENFGESVLRLDVNDDGTTAALGFDDHAIAVDIATGRTRATVTPGGDRVRVAIDDNVFIVAGEDLVITDLDTDAEQRLDIPADVTTNGLLVDPGTNTIVVGGRKGDRGGVLLVWRDGASVPIRRDIDRVGVSAQGLDIDDDGRWLAVGRNDGRVELWSLDEMELADIAFTRHDLQITDVTFAPGSATVVSLDADGVVWLWSAEVGTSFAQPIWSGLEYGRRVLVDSAGTEVTVVGRGGVVGIATDAATIQEFGCTLAGIEPCPATAGDVQTVLREE
jgi:WD40 repeat protein